MDILYLLIPLSVLLVLGLIVLFAWALHSGQFDDIEREGERILAGTSGDLDGDQAKPARRPEQSAPEANTANEDIE